MPRTETKRVETPCRLRLPVVAAALLLAVLAGPAWQGTAPAAADRAAPRIIGGQLAQPEDWQSQVALLDARTKEASEAQFCGGTLIAPDWVLTAAHCLYRPAGHPQAGKALSPSDLDLAIGIDTLTRIGVADRLRVTRMVTHPAWSSASLSSNFRWDFALLRLAKPSTRPTAAIIQPSQVSATTAGRPAFLAGWGCTSMLAEGCAPDGYPDRLFQLRTSFVSAEQCKGLWGAYFDPAVMICAGSVASGPVQRACSGDSGGSLAATVGGRRVLAGVTSFGSAKPLCVAEGLPSVFARVDAARGWIESQLGRKPDLTGIELEPASRSVRAGRKVSLRVTVTNAGDAAATAKVRLSTSNRRKAKVPGTVAVPVDANGSATGTFTVRTVRGKLGTVTVRATIGPRTVSSKITLKG